MRKRGFFGAVVLPLEVGDSAGFAELAELAGFDWFVGFAEFAEFAWFAWFAWFVGFAEGVSLFKGFSIEAPILNRMANISAGINLVTAESSI